MVLANATIVDENFRLAKCDLRLHNGKIVEIGESLTGEYILDLNNKYILPGFIDTHIHGACGTGISEKRNAELGIITQFEATQGVTGIAITTASSEFDDLLVEFDCAVAAAMREPQGAKILGIHAEGPFLNTKRKGAMNVNNIILPEIDKLDAMIHRGKGLLKLITVAPEMPGAVEMIRHAVKNGVKVSMGHSDATLEEAQSGIVAGATEGTHTFNAMCPYNHREPGILGAVLLSDNVTCEMLCDYVHLHPATCELIYRLKGADRIRMVSDSGEATGLNISEFEVNGTKQYVQDGVVRLADGTIAGSAKSLLGGVKNMLLAGVPLGDVVKMASYNPAKCLGLEQQLGSIALGKCADITVLNREFDVEYTFVNGKCVYRVSDSEKN